MRNINKVILIGNIAKAPEVRMTHGGQKMATFVLATNRTWYDPQRQKQSQAEFHNMLAWGKIAEICEKFLQKSTLVYIEGYLKTRTWEGEDNARFYRTEIVIQDILVLDRGIRHGSSQRATDEEENDADYLEAPHHDFDLELDASLEQRPASELERSFQQKLSAGNSMTADTTLARAGNKTTGDHFFLDQPLFEEEAK